MSDAANPTGTAPGPLTHLAWLENVELPNPAAPPAAGSEASYDLRLLAVSASAADANAHSTLATYAFCEEPYQLSEAFAGLECKKGDATVGGKVWSGRRVAGREMAGLVTGVLARAEAEFGSFVVVEARVVDGGQEGGSETVVSSLRATSLQTLDHLGETMLPAQSLYPAIAASAGLAILSASPFSLPSCPVLAPFPLAFDPSTLPPALATRLALSLLHQLDTADLAGRITSAGEPAAKFVARHARDALQAVLPPATALEATALLPELLGVTAAVYGAFPALEVRGRLAGDVVGLGACVRAFGRSQLRERGVAVEGAYRCESDAVWPLVAHARWYCAFAAGLVREGGAEGPAPRVLLVLHPYSRGLLLQAATYILGLQAFLAAFPPAQNFTVDMARQVLDDAIDSAGLVLTEWRAALVGASDVEGLTGDSAELASLLVRFEVPTSLATARAVVGALLANPALRAPVGPPTPPATPPPFGSPSLALGSASAAAGEATDIVRRARLGPAGAGRVEEKGCTRCGGRTEVRQRTGMESGKWAAWEAAWEGRCACGGAWRLERVKLQI